MCLQPLPATRFCFLCLFFFFLLRILRIKHQAPVLIGATTSKNNTKPLHPGEEKGGGLDK